MPNEYVCSAIGTRLASIEGVMNNATLSTQPKDCTGSRYQGEGQMLASIEGWHGKFGHGNVVVLDHDSACTGFGAHDLVSAYLPQWDETLGTTAVYCRISLKWELGMPTEEQIIAVARADADIKGRWKLASTQPWPEVNALDCYLVRA